MPPNGFLIGLKYFYEYLDKKKTIISKPLKHFFMPILCISESVYQIRKIQNCHHWFKIQKERFWWFFRWLQSIKWSRITIKKWFQNFSSDAKKKKFSQISNDFYFSSVDIQSDIDIRKMKIVGNWTIIFFFRSRTKLLKSVFKSNSTLFYWL